ncbi:hypothetical protein ACRYWZ_13700 [Agrobacterium deltaense]|uniref:hypothetical protein n=1 Tax=Agrobacterium deltaense TaxID=1183412 RepID=UPI003D98206F
MSETVLAALTNIRTAEDMIVAFRDEEQCRRVLERMKTLWSRVPPALQLPQVFHAATGRQMR